MDNKEQFIEAAEYALGKFTLAEKLLAAGAISHDTTYFMMPEDFWDEEGQIALNLLLVQHMIVAGPRSLEMAVRGGKAIKASIQNPIKKRTGLIQRFKDTVKELVK